MTRLGLTAGFGDPLGGLLDELADRQVDVARQSLRPDSSIEACVQDFAGRRVRPHFVIPRLVDVHIQMRPLLMLIVEHLGPDGADVAAGNESSINGETIDQAVQAVEITQRIAAEVGFTGGIYASSIPNLDPGRDFQWMRLFWPRLSREVVRDFHRYPEIRFPWDLDDRHPWHQFGSLDAELAAVRELAGEAPLSISEFAHSTVRRHWLGTTRQVTNEQAADYLTDDLVLYAKHGLVDAMVYQINSGSNPNEWGDCQGIRDVAGNWLPQAECFARARAQLASEEPQHG